MRAVYVFWAVPATTFALGTWQVQRAEWKNGLLDEQKRRWHQEPLDLAALLNNREEKVDDHTGVAEATRWRRVCVRGTWTGKDVVVGPKYVDREQGGHLISLMKLENSDRYVLVNRGWIPKELSYKEQGHRAGEPDSTDQAVAVDAFVRHKSERVSRFTPENFPEKDEWHWFDQDAMYQTLGVSAERALPFAVEELKRHPRPPLGGLIPPELPNNHRDYYITWYSLSVATAAMCIMLMRRKNPAAASSTGSAGAATAAALAIFAPGERRRNMRSAARG